MKKIVPRLVSEADALDSFFQVWLSRLLYDTLYTLFCILVCGYIPLDIDLGVCACVCGRAVCVCAGARSRVAVCVCVVCVCVCECVRLCVYVCVCARVYSRVCIYTCACADRGPERARLRRRARSPSLLLFAIPSVPLATVFPFPLQPSLVFLLPLQCHEEEEGLEEELEFEEEEEDEEDEEDER